MSEIKKVFALADNIKFVTFAFDSVKLSTVHRNEKGKGKKVDEKDTKAPGSRGHNHPYTWRRADGAVM